MAHDIERTGSEKESGEAEAPPSNGNVIWQKLAEEAWRLGDDEAMAFFEAMARKEQSDAANN